MAGRKASRAGVADSAATSIPGDVAAELAGLRQSIDQLGQGLTQLLDATATHTELLRHLLAAVTAPTEPENPVADLLRHIAARLADQGVMLRSLDATIAKLPEEVGAAVSAQLASALASVR